MSCTMIRMLKLIIAILLLLIFVGCSKYDHPLAVGKKAKLIAEQIIDNSRCNSFRNRLTLPAIDDEAIDAIYHDAMNASCISKDI